MTLLDRIESHIPALRRYARALAQDRDAADDLVQDCLEKAVARRAGWRGDGPLRAWLFRILLNCHRDGLRRRPRSLQAIDDLPEPPTVAGAQEAHMALAEVQRAIATLPDDQRAALLLVALEGMSFDEAAAALDVPPGTLMSRLARARARLRDLTGRPKPGRPASRRHKT